ncbi:MAG: MFS transporter [Ruminococcaceae bacterium]|nr:MFS transporter [Oscillospiraceae bacterium]
MNQNQSSLYKKDQFLVIIEAAVEYFIALCVTSTFLTAILNEMNVSASLQGIISAITSLACCVQLVAVFGVKKTYPCKRWVSILNLLNQLLFVILYCIPMVDLSKELKIAIFIGTLLLAYACQHYLTPSRVNWQMNLIEDNRRGIFTANKEIVSLISGMLFSQGAGILLDYFKAKGDMTTCFIIFAVTITVLSLLHLALMLMIKEPKPEKPIPPKSFREICTAVFGSPELRRVILFDALFAISGVSLHFSAVYLTQTFHMTYTYITAIAILHSLFRAVVSRYLGRLADRKSWAYMLRICMFVLAAGYVVFCFCSPTNAFWLYPVFSLCYAFSLGGSNAGRTNLCLDYVSHEDRRYVLGIQHAISGVLAFVVTLLASLLVEVVEQNGNRVFGISVYPQQILFGISAVMILGLAFFFLPKLKKPARVTETDTDTP